MLLSQAPCVPCPIPVVSLLSHTPLPLVSMNNSNCVFRLKWLLHSQLGASTEHPASKGGGGRKSMNGSGTSSVRTVSPASKIPFPLLSRKLSSPCVYAITLTIPDGGTSPSVSSVAVAMPLVPVVVGFT